MSIERTDGFGFKDRVLPDLEGLLQLSLSLTENGRDAIRLMRKAMAEAQQSWDESMQKECRRSWLHGILTKQFFDGFQKHSHTFVPVFGNRTEGSLRPTAHPLRRGTVGEVYETSPVYFATVALSARGALYAEGARPIPRRSPAAHQRPFAAGEFDEDFFKGVAGLPAAFRSAMILSYLEGFSNKEIGNLAGVRPQAVESLLNRGRELLGIRELIREQIFIHLMDSDCLNTVSYRAAISA